MKMENGDRGNPAERTSEEDLVGLCQMWYG